MYAVLFETIISIRIIGSANQDSKRNFVNFITLMMIYIYINFSRKKKKEIFPLYLLHRGLNKNMKYF